MISLTRPSGKPVEESIKFLRVGAVVLNYNSSDDLGRCIGDLTNQVGVDVQIVIVDNASDNEERRAAIAVVKRMLPGSSLTFSKNSARQSVPQRKHTLVLNNINNGYSFGNNIGARMLVSAGCDMILIINPDVRLPDVNYIRSLLCEMLSSNNYVVAGSALVNLAGRNENPMTELTYLEEVFWPLWLVCERLGLQKNKNNKLSSSDENIKVSGACVLIRGDFLESIDYLDERVFMYCEESILRTQVTKAGKKTIYCSKPTAIHAHKSKTKGSKTKRVKMWIKSRQHYHEFYTCYSPIKRRVLRISQAIILLVTQTRELREKE